eukprot:Transcript_20805.p1 GENE.Transcript_20805~~Transcript_20805.p1  ORF type:complete len:316 (+),score=45.81 Transcript_20805:52-948(+)
MAAAQLDVTLLKPTADVKLGLILHDRHDGPCVSRLRPGSIAEASAQFQAGDRVLAVNGQPVSDHEAATGLMRASPAGAVTIAVERVPGARSVPSAPPLATSSSSSARAARAARAASAPTSPTMRARRPSASGDQSARQQALVAHQAVLLPPDAGDVEGGPDVAGDVAGDVASDVAGAAGAAGSAAGSGARTLLREAAEAAGVPLELAEQIEASGVRAVVGSSWVSRASASKHRLSPPMPLREALLCSQTFPGAQRGWALHFDDGSYLRRVRAGRRRDGRPHEGRADWGRREAARYVDQ